MEKKSLEAICFQALGKDKAAETEGFEPILSFADKQYFKRAINNKLMNYS